MGGGVGGLLYSLRSGTVKFNLSNGRGDVVAQSNSAGDLTWTASYEAYGKRPVETGTNADRQRANTKEEDPTGLLNEGFRHRDLETAVWMSRDPAGFVAGPNLYAYVRQNPWTAFDPDGLVEEKVARNPRRDLDENGQFHPEAKLYKIERNPDARIAPNVTLVKSAKDIDKKNATIWVNGMANPYEDAITLGLNHVDAKEFYMVHNPSNGGLSDFGECCVNKLMIDTKVSNTTTDILRNFDLKSATIIAHSQGTMIMNKSLKNLRDEGVDMKGLKLAYHGSAANLLRSKLFAKSVGAEIIERNGHSLDAVHNIVGMNTVNPLRIAGSVVAAPLLFGHSSRSPHTNKGGGQDLTKIFKSPLFHPLEP